MKLENKIAIITGASSGFGRAIAEAYAREGAHVVVADLQEAPLRGGFEDAPQQTTVEAIASHGGKAHFVRCDVTRAADVDHLIAEAVATFGRLDIMFNNAGIYRGGKLFHEFDESDLDACFDVNVKGTWLGSKAAVKQFLKQGDGGVILNLVSTAGLQGHPKQSVYNISKGAQANLTRCLAIEYGRDGIRVAGICPTYAKTALTRALFDDKDFDTFFTESIPLKRWGEASDIASLAVFLASDDASYIHGALIPVDGGETLCRYSV